MANGIVAASKKLELIEQHLDDYEDEESIAPTAEVVAGVREFLNALGEESSGLHIPEPKLFVSPNGHIVVSIGEKPYEVIIRFSPQVCFVSWHQQRGECKGEGMTNAVNAVKEHVTT